MEGQTPAAWVRGVPSMLGSQKEPLAPLVPPIYPTRPAHFIRYTRRRLATFRSAYDAALQVVRRPENLVGGRGDPTVTLNPCGAGDGGNAVGEVDLCFDVSSGDSPDVRAAGQWVGWLRPWSRAFRQMWHVFRRLMAIALWSLGSGAHGDCRK